MTAPRLTLETADERDVYLAVFVCEATGPIERRPQATQNADDAVRAYRERCAPEPRDVPRDYAVPREQLQRLLAVILNPDGEQMAYALDPVGTVAGVDAAIAEVARLRGPECICLGTGAYHEDPPPCPVHGGQAAIAWEALSDIEEYIDVHIPDSGRAEVNPILDTILTARDARRGPSIPTAEEMSTDAATLQAGHEAEPDPDRAGDERCRHCHASPKSDGDAGPTDELAAREARLEDLITAVSAARTLAEDPGPKGAARLDEVSVMLAAALVAAKVD